METTSRNRRRMWLPIVLCVSFGATPVVVGLVDQGPRSRVAARPYDAGDFTEGMGRSGAHVVRNEEKNRTSVPSEPRTPDSFALKRELAPALFGSNPAPSQLDHDTRRRELFRALFERDAEDALHLTVQAMANSPLAPEDNREWSFAQKEMATLFKDRKLFASAKDALLTSRNPKAKRFIAGALFQYAQQAKDLSAHKRSGLAMDMIDVYFATNSDALKKDIESQMGPAFGEELAVALTAQPSDGSAVSSAAERQALARGAALVASEETLSLEEFKMLVDFLKRSDPRALLDLDDAATLGAHPSARAYLEASIAAAP